MDERIVVLMDVRDWAASRRDDCNKRAEIVNRMYGLTDEFFELQGQAKAFAAVATKLNDVIKLLK